MLWDASVGQYCVQYAVLTKNSDREKDGLGVDLTCTVRGRHG